MKQKILLAAVLIIIIISGIWLAAHGTVRVDPSLSSSDPYHYQIVSGDGKMVSEGVATGTLSRLVPRGIYQITISRDNENYFAVITTSGFLKTTTVDAALQSEASRRFVGMNPGSCMYFTDHLLSGVCGAALADIQSHVPASALQPTYTDKIPSDTSGAQSSPMQIVQTKNGLLGLAAQVSSTDERAAGYYLTTFRTDFTVAGQRRLTELSEQDMYYTQAYKDGMLIYDGSRYAAWYVSDATSALQKVAVAKADDAKLRLNAVTASNDAVTALFTDQTIGIDSDESTDITGGKSEVAISIDGNSRHYNFNTIISSAQICGTNKLCAVSGNTLTVYDVSSDKAKALDSISDVTNLSTIQGRTLINTKTGILDYDVDNQTGYFVYSFGKYASCGLNAAPDGYLVCITDPKGQREALYITSSTKDADSIDKKVLTLSGIEAIKDLSLYDTYIFITPEYGATKFDWTTRTITYDPEKKSAADTAIRQALTKSRIDTSKYQIINLGEI